MYKEAIDVLLDTLAKQPEEHITSVQIEAAHYLAVPSLEIRNLTPSQFLQVLGWDRDFKKGHHRLRPLMWLQQFAAHQKSKALGVQLHIVEESYGASPLDDNSSAKELSTAKAQLSYPGIEQQLAVQRAAQSTSAGRLALQPTPQCLNGIG